MTRGTCEGFVDQALEARLEQIARLMCGPAQGMLEKLEDYALCFEYIQPDTFNDQVQGYFRYLIAWGRPTDEFRFFVNIDASALRIEYWFLDGPDSAHRDCSHDPIAVHLWQHLLGSLPVSRWRRALCH